MKIRRHTIHGELSNGAPATLNMITRTHVSGEQWMICTMTVRVKYAFVAGNEADWMTNAASEGERRILMGYPEG